MKNTFLLLLLTLGLGLHAQSDLSSLQLPDSWAALNANPAVQPKGLLIGLPEVYNNFWTSNLTISDLVVTENGTDRLDVQNAIDNMGATNVLSQQLDLNTVGVGFQLGPIGLHVGH
ncbi:MAG: hypothetical protein AAGJ82_08875, partial [Bacteroidota bacterium]